MATQTTTQYTNALAAQRPAVTSPVKPMEGTRSYKDFLTAALHHRFRRACYLLLTACYTESLLMRWNWASFTGIRALLLFMPCLAVFILRVANMHVGVQTTASVAESVYKTATSWKTAHTLAWYVYSAWFFGEVYLWSRGDNANLGWVDQGRRYEDGAWERSTLIYSTDLLLGGLG
jgi:nucleoporin NDC1